MNEFELIQKYFKKDPLDPFVVVGNGDDAAVFAPRDDSECVISVDAVIAGRHVPDLCPPDGFAARLIGRGLSDLAAICLLYTSPRPRDGLLSRMPSSA